MTSINSDGSNVKPRSKRDTSTLQNPALDSDQQSSDIVPQGSNSNTLQNPQPADIVQEEVNTNVIRPDCPLLLRGECPYGISGKKNGNCQYLHRPRCSTYMKWGDKSSNGCKKVPCSKLHPHVCPRSLDLKCFVQNCDVKLHIKKCVRERRGAQNRNLGREDGQAWSSGHRANSQRNYSDASHDMHNSHVQGRQQGHRRLNGRPGNRFNATPSFQDRAGESRNFQADIRNPLHNQDVTSPDTSSIWNQNQNLIQRCTSPNPAVHQLLEVWAGNMQKQIENQVKEMQMFLGGQSLNRPSF